MLTLNWPVTVCKLEDNYSSPKSCRLDLPLQFTIHGLWPQLSQLSSLISYCKNNKEKFDVKLLGSIFHELDRTWPSAFSDDATSFWKHEWDKHGTCTSFTMTKYFHESIALYNKYPLLEWLQRFDIHPSDTHSYPTGLVAAALEKHIPKTRI